jgi:hypothetical protein
MGRRVGWAGPVVGVLLFAASSPAHASSTLVAPDGAVHTVTEVRTRYRLDTESPGPWYLAYSVVYADGEARTGVIAPTGDLAQDSGPRLALDPVTRKPVVVWTRDDGTSLQIAYTRYEGADWGDFHYLTFARSNETQPRLGDSVYGSFLFFVEDWQRYMYAPVDLSHGRLYAAPRSISQKTLQQRTEESTSGSSFLAASRLDAASMIYDPGDATIQGGQDVPIVVHCEKNSGCKNASVWDVGSRHTCRPQVLVIPDNVRYVAYVVRFENGSASLIQTVPIPYEIPPDFGATTAATFLESICAPSY